MSLIATAVKHLIAAGVGGDDLVRAIAEMEAAMPAAVDHAADRRRAADRERKRRVRNCPQNSADIAEKVSPTPPSKNAPLSAPKGASFPPPGPQPAEQPKIDLADELWSVASKPSRTRSGRPALRRAVKAAVAKGATSEALLASIRDHCRTAGDHAKGVHRIIEGEHWREHRPAKASAGTVAPAIHASRLRRYRDTGVWEPGWGPEPPRPANDPGQSEQRGVG